MPAARRPYSKAERLADGVIHVIGVTFGLAASVALAALSLPRGDLLLLLSLGLYAMGMLSMLGCSALYNMTHDETRKQIFRRLDHAAIFVMIAGTYTPFVLIAIGGAWGLGLLAFVWSVAAAGVFLKLCYPRRFERLSVAVYLLLGWTILVAVEPFVTAVSTAGIVLILTGGLLYSLGVIFYLWKRLPYHNAIWHAFVLAAVVCHFSAVVGDIAIAA
ncbi:MAG: hemolysin III family protein [Kiloniellales bacterium]|nr:hemolysin III family protein [Kiloniellales bacterium]